MAVSTTQSIWRSGGGDNTRTAYCGSGIMAAQFWIDDDTVAGRVKVNSSANAPDLILPAGAVVLSAVLVFADSAGTIDLTAIGYNSNTNVGTIANNLSVAATGTVALTGTPTTEMAYVTMADPASTTGTAVGGWLTYFVYDELAGQQNV